MANIPTFRRWLALLSVTSLVAGGLGASVYLWEVQSAARDVAVAGTEVEVGRLSAPQPLGSRAVSIGIEEPRAWPNLFGPSHDNIAPLGDGAAVAPWGAAGPPVVWSLPCGAGYSSPIIWHDQIVLLERVGDDEIIRCVAAGDGSPVWEYRYPTEFQCGSHYTNGPYSTPATDGEHVYALGAEGRLHCLELTTGDFVWERRLATEFAVPTEIFGQGHSPLVWGDLLILNVGGTASQSGIIAFDKRTGEIRWQATDDRFSYATPQPARIHNRDWLLVLTRAGLVLLDPADGRVVTTVAYECRVPEAFAAVTPVVHGDLVLLSIFGTGTRVLRVHADGTCEDVWESKRVLTSQYTPLICREGCVYGVHALDNSFRCVDLATGEIRWREKSVLANCKPLVVGDRMVMLGEFGHLGLIECRPDAWNEPALTEKSLFGDEERCYSAPAYVGGRLYVRNEQKLLCLDLTGAENR
jgi:outer membrane protein assembly factor BamB